MTVDSTEEEQERRRRQEIDMFAALALASNNDDHDTSTDFVEATNHHESSSSPPVTTTSTPQQQQSPQQQQQQQQHAGGGGSLEAFQLAAAAGAAEASGTFYVSTTPHRHDAALAEQSNLEAAAAALSEDVTTTTSKTTTTTAPSKQQPPPPDVRTRHRQMPPSSHQRHQAQSSSQHSDYYYYSQQQQQNDVDNAPMFANQVVLQRPLFFGSILPPRVLKQGRTMVRQAMMMRNLEEESPNSTTAAQLMSLRDMPESVCNLVGAIRTYGYGLEDLLFDNDDDTTLEKNDNGNEFWRGSPCVTTFQPVWGQDVRAQRVKEFRRKNRPPHVKLRSRTAPPRLWGSSDVPSPSEIFAEQADSQEQQEEPLDENKQFGLWLRSCNEDNQSNIKDSAAAAPAKQQQHTSNNSSSAGATNSSIKSKSAAGDNNHSAASPPLNEEEEEKGGRTSPKMTEQEIFSQWARGGDQGTFLRLDQQQQQQSAASSNSDTFQRFPTTATSDDQDDDSVVDDELKRTVGQSDQLSKAIASLADDGSQQLPPSDAIIVEQQQGSSSKVLLHHQQTTLDRARPLTNYELTNGCVPLFGVDDSPLPVESDLGVHETKDEQLRSNELKRSQETIEKCVTPNVFGPIACPNPALNPDDFHSWNARAVPSQHHHHHHHQHHLRAMDSGASTTTAAAADQSVAGAAASHQKHLSLGSMDSLATKVSQEPRATTTKASSKVSAKRYKSRTRYGWWNVSSEESSSGAGGKATKDSSKKDDNEQDDSKVLLADGGDDANLPLQLPPIHHSSTVMQVVTLLEPTPKELCEANLPLSRMNAATSMAQTLPYLSDRPPSYRYLQVDTQAVGFPPLGAEIEPLFCTLAIYNVETVSSNSGGSDNAAAPVPDLQRCGRVTEALNFDVISDKDVMKHCAGALWPYTRAELVEEGVPNKRLSGTRCGVFPIPSNLSVSNLYAVLIVRKVLSDGSDLEPYLKAGQTSVNIERLRSRAEKASGRNGHFLIPFAFGVAPLLQVFGTDNPTVATSRAVQIPLFRFSGEERRIIDHIMVMLYPRADHSASGIGGPAAVTNGGTAMLVMRNFGYLGLHSVVDRRSSLARDRLVDFTGELQLRRKDEVPSGEESKSPQDPYTTVLPEWHSKFVGEPTTDGGRNRLEADSVEREGSLSSSQLYAQELAPLPLQLTPSLPRLSAPSLKPGMPRGRLHGDDIEPFYHLSFCNELIFHPRLLHNCPKGNISIKVELREVEWNQEFNGYFAHLPRTGPSIHNARRGPFLVQSAFTTCSRRSNDHHFIDEFKVKLPLDLKPGQHDDTARTLALFFTIYNVKVNSKSTWKRAKKKLLSGLSADANESEEILGVRLDQVSCGFLPLTSNTSLVENGMHDVQLIYTARSPPQELLSRELVNHNTLVLVDRSDLGESSLTSSLREDSYAEDASDTGLSDRVTGSESAARTDSSGNSASEPPDHVSVGSRGKTKGITNADPLSLSVRIVVHSSLHSQNESLASFLQQEPDLPRSCRLPGPEFMLSLKMGPEFLRNNTDGRSEEAELPYEDKLLELTIDVSKHQLCSFPQVSAHLLRIMPLLWRFMLYGSGEPDLVWANPSASLPLRVHSFATIMHLVGSTTLYFSKNGVTQVDGVSAWNVVTLGRVLALLFDEGKLFAGQSTEVLDEEQWLPRETAGGKACGSASEKRKKRRHIRQTYDLFNDMPPREGLGGASDVSSSRDGTPGSPSRGRHDHVKLPEDEIDTIAPWKDELHFKDDSKAEADQPAPEPIKRDTKTDFQSALRASSLGDDVDGLENRESDGIRAAAAMIQGLGGISGNRRYMTAPTRALSTILEAEDTEDPDQKRTESESTSSTLDTREASADEKEVTKTRKRSTFQFRVPKAKHAQSLPDRKPPPSPSPETVPRTDEEIKEAGEAFLEVIGRSLGISSAPDSLAAAETRRVGCSHHRKRWSQSSIDWSLIGGHEVVGLVRGPSASEENGSKDDIGDIDERMSTLRKEEESCIRLPNFLDRLALIGKTSDKAARWFPYAYEVVIMQWAAILLAQRSSADMSSTSRSSDKSTTGSQWTESSLSGNESLSQAAARSVGVAVASAPMLFEVIKQSLGFRVSSLFREAMTKNGDKACPPLVMLDDALLLNLERVVSMVTDACLDSRNFDSWDLRQMSINVNDSIVRFLRDMFSFLAPSSVHRLILVYLSRFVTKEGKQWQDRDSRIGLRCSWEITKLRLNAVTALVRFPDFVRVNGPQMMNWDNWIGKGFAFAADKFFDEVLKRYRRFRLSDLVGNEEAPSKANIDLPSMKPHWLSEIVIDICLLGSGHAEQYIQHRSSSLLHELFWACSQGAILNDRSAPVGAMYVTFLEKILPNVVYLSSFPPKNQIRKDIVPCVLFIAQAAPANLLRALWRSLIFRFAGEGTSRKRGGVADSFLNQSMDFGELTNSFSNRGGDEKQPVSPSSSAENNDDTDILDVFSLLNLCLKSIEYEGSDERLDHESPISSRESLELWRREYLLALSRDYCPENRGRRKTAEKRSSSSNGVYTGVYTSSTSRKWQAHDGSITSVNTAHQIVLEMCSILGSSTKGRSLLNPAISRPKEPGVLENASPCAVNLSYADIVIFVRAATSVYLHSLALRESDIVIVRTFRVSAETIKIFGIRLFLEALGETLQHWMRAIFLHCGARRAYVRVEATDLLALILRSTWDCYGSFFRIRVPLLAVQTEVMERIVATAATRFYRDQRRLGTSFETFSNLNAEASLVPLWRTLDRLEKQPASQNIAFRGALIRMAEKLKKLYRAYVAARVLSFIQSARTNDEGEGEYNTNYETEALVRARRINIMRVINASEGISKQFLGFQGTSQRKTNLVHYEAVEDALLDAADVFSPTELPEHRVAWLRMLADFHAKREKFAEEATCHFNIHATLQQAARLHPTLWSNTPFLPWTDSMSDPVYIYGDSHNSDTDLVDMDFGAGGTASSFRRIFYRVANSVAITSEDWEAGGCRNLFYGVADPSEYHTVRPWITLREMEENMVEEAEAAGELFRRAGIIQSSRVAWNLSTQYYAEKFNYAKLAIAYGNLAKTVVTQVPPIDSSLPQEVSATLGRYYRVWFHGGAPDDLTGVEFVYRTEGAVSLEQFGEELRDVIKTIMPDNTPIHLFMDGRTEKKIEDSSLNYGFSRLGPTPLEPVRIKVTPLRPLSSTTSTRGSPEWFLRYADETFSELIHRSQSDLSHRKRRNGSGQMESATDPHHRSHARSFSATIFSSVGSSTAATSRRDPLSSAGVAAERYTRAVGSGEEELSGVDRFCFVQPRDRKRVSKDWWKSSVDRAEKVLKVTQLQVQFPFPACVTRQVVVHRLVYYQSQLEAGVDAICQWCAVLFRTAVATSGQAVLGENTEPGIGTDAAKVVADCLHSSNVKEIGRAVLQNDSDLVEGGGSAEFSVDYDRLTDDEVARFRLKFARLAVVYIELLHLLIARNRDLLLDVIQERKRGNIDLSGATSTHSQRYVRAQSMGLAHSEHQTASYAHSVGSRDASPHYHTTHVTRGRDGRGTPTSDIVQHHHQQPLQPPPIPPPVVYRQRSASDTGSVRLQHKRIQSADGEQSVLSSAIGGAGDTRTDSAIAVQSELQRAFISLCKSLYPRVHETMLEETPRWLKQCAQDNYFSLGTYRQTKIPIAEELCLGQSENLQSSVASEAATGHSVFKGGGGDVHSETDARSLGAVSHASSHHSAVSRGSFSYSAR